MSAAELTKAIIGYAISFIELCGALVVVVAVLRALWGYFRNLLGKDCEQISALRVRLGQCLVMAIEFQVAADILRTAVSPTWDEILFLAVLIVLRTLLNYLLELEVRGFVRPPRKKTKDTDMIKNRTEAE